MPWRTERRHWYVNGANGASAARVASRLARLEAGEEIRYRGVHIGVQALEVPAGCSIDSREALARLFLLQAFAWPVLRLPQHQRLPCHWRSEVMTMPRRPDAPMARLMLMETEFALRAFLYRVEREIDGVFQRSEDYTQSWPRT